MRRTVATAAAVALLAATQTTTAHATPPAPTDVQVGWYDADLHLVRTSCEVVLSEEVRLLDARKADLGMFAQIFGKRGRPAAGRADDEGEASIRTGGKWLSH